MCSALDEKSANSATSSKARAFTESTASHGRGDYEIDHLIPLELGGSNSVKNLWPESYRTSRWNARVKDRLEDKLHELVCNGQLDLKTAQQVIAANWIEAYKKSAIRSISDPAAPVQRHLRQARQLDSESTSGGNGHMIRNSPEIISMRRQISLQAKFVSGGFLLGAACRRSVPNAKRQSPRITQPVRSPDAIWRASRQKFAMPRSPTNP